MKNPIAAALLLGTLWLPSLTSGQGSQQSTDQEKITSLTRQVEEKQAELGQAKSDKEKVLAMMRRVEEQQMQIEDNQIRINTQLSDATEKVRQAWVFSRRASH